MGRLRVPQGVRDEMMTHKQQMLAVLHGQPTDSIPWVPRLDLWYRAHRRARTLPRRYADASLVEMLDDLNFAYHAVIPDFKALRTRDDEAHRALGIYNLACMPVRTVFDGIEYRITQDGDQQIVEYNTPAGSLTTVTVYDESMRTAGVTITHVMRYAFSGPQDYEPLCCLFRSARAEPNYEGYAGFAREIGDRGFATAYLSSAASPMHLIQRELMQLDVFFYEMNDRPEEVHRLAECIGEYWREMYLDDFFRQIGRGDRLILGISDTTPPGAEFDRLLKIRDRIEAFGPVAAREL